MPERREDPNQDNDGDVMAGDRRIARPDTALPDWHNPDTSYRPIPITWFAGAFLVQSITLTAIFVIFLSAPAAVTIGLSMVVTYIIIRETWARGMRNAGPWWRGATLAVLGIQLAFIILVSIERL